MKVLEPLSPPSVQHASRPRPAARPDSRVSDHGWPVAILGVPFDNVTLGGAVARIGAMIASRRPHYVATANVDFLVQAQADVELRRILLEADMVLCDGTPLVWASRWLGNPLRERVAGADLVPALIQEAALKQHRIFLLGAGAGVAETAAARLQRQYPSLIIAGHYSPPYSGLLEMDHEDAAERIREARPDLLFVSFGCPKQEKWIAMHYRSLGVPVVIGVGASLDFLAERVRRAPRWMQQVGLEWGFRLAQEPRRLVKRYANDLMRFVPGISSQLLNVSPRLVPFMRRPDHRALFTAATWIQVWAAESLTHVALKKNAAFWHEATQQDRHCLLDLSLVRAIDSTGVALLGRWRQRLHALGFKLILISPSEEVKRVLAHLQFHDHFATAGNWAEAQGLIKAAQTKVRPVSLGGSPRPLAWRGEVTAENTDEVWKLTTDLIRSLGARGVTLLIDLSEVRFIDSSGVGLMLRITSWARQQETEVRFVNPNSDVLNVLKLTRLDHLLLQEV